MDKTTIFNVVLSADEGYSAHLEAVIISLLLNCSNPNEVQFYILDGGLSEETRQEIESIVKRFDARIIFSTEAQLEYAKYTVNSDRMSIAAYYRISIPDILPKTCKTALYLDCDIIVEGDVLQLKDINLSDNEAIAAVEDISRSPAYKLLNIPANHYFNSGVMLINLAYWRSMKTSEKVRLFKRNHSHLLTTNDQCALNGILWKNWKRLPPKWNQQSGIYKKRFRKKGTGYTEAEIIEGIKKPNIIHYVGSRKPWRVDCPHPLRDRYHYYRAILDPVYKKPSPSETLRAAVRSGTLRHLLKSAIFNRKKLWNNDYNR